VFAFRNQQEGSEEEMKLKVLPVVGALATVLLSGCAPFYLFFKIPTNATPVVRVDNQVIKAVEPEPLRFKAGAGEVTITWQVDDPGLRFAASNGIVIDGERIGGRLDPKQNEIVRCVADNERRRFSCLNRNTRKGEYKYTVRLETSDGKPLTPFDPSIINGDML
jgi:hypothetical protein